MKMHTNIFLFQSNKENKMNNPALNVNHIEKTNDNAVQMDMRNCKQYITELNPIDGNNRLCHYLDNKVVINIATSMNLDPDRKLNHILAPMGSGKTTLFKSFIDDVIGNLYVKVIDGVMYPLTANDVMVFTPFIVNSQEYAAYDDYGVVSEHLINFCTNVFDTCLKDTDSNLSKQEQNILIVERLECFYSNKVILIDEGDFTCIQTFVSGAIVNVTKECSKMPNELVQLVLKTLCRISIFNLSVSANRFKYPDNSPINEFMLSIPVNNHVDNMIIYDASSMNKSNLNRDINKMLSNLGDYLGSDSSALVYRSKFNDSTFKTIMDDGYVLTREENIPTVRNENNGTKSLVGGDNCNVKLVNEHVLSDSMMRNADLIGINTSSTRCSSLRNEYDNPWVIVIQPHGVTSSALQSLGRFRNVPINVLWIGDVFGKVTMSNLATTIDPFFGQYCKTFTKIDNL